MTELKLNRAGSLFERIRIRPPRWVRWGLYIPLILAFIIAEYKQGFTALYPLVFSIPILVATWWDGRPMGYGLAALSMVPWTFHHSWAQFGTRGLALILLIELTGNTVDLIKRVRILEGLLPICMHCHRIQEANKQWVRLEEYVQKHTEATFSHGICTTCMHQRYPSEEGGS